MTVPEILEHPQVTERELIKRVPDAPGVDRPLSGGYGHSRIRELVLGGVTRNMLRHDTSLPILMAH
jgi:nucleotide-binding universal stress UspA family protein